MFTTATGDPLVSCNVTHALQDALARAGLPRCRLHDLRHAYAIRAIPGVTGFVGSNRNQKPQSISQEEARSILAKTGEIKADRIMKPRQTFSVGEMVRIIDGPFDSFTGSIEEVNTEKGKLRVMVGIFGRSTPVEVDFLQVEKI